MVFLMGSEASLYSVRLRTRAALNEMTSSILLAEVRVESLPRSNHECYNFMTLRSFEIAPARIDRFHKLYSP